MIKLLSFLVVLGAVVCMLGADGCENPNPYYVTPDQQHTPTDKMETTNPDIEIISPSDYTQVAMGQMVTMTVHAWDASGIKKVEFYENCNGKTGTAYSEPYSWSFTYGSPGVGGGQHVLVTATAYDNYNNTSKASVHVIFGMR